MIVKSIAHSLGASVNAWPIGDVDVTNSVPSCSLVGVDSVIGSGTETPDNNDAVTVTNGELGPCDPAPNENGDVNPMPKSCHKLI